MKYITTTLLLITSFLYSQDKVLVFTKTNGYEHGSISAGVTMIKELGIANKLWIATETKDGNEFTETNLANYKAVIWCNTSGSNLLTAAQRTAFEKYIRKGGGFVGIHAATDTYKDGSWPFYNELVGAIIQSGPNHTANNFNATMTVINSHPSVDFLGKTWGKMEEYYYWKNKGGYLYPGNITLLKVEATGTNDYDEARPISWYKKYEGGRSFYTALGHNSSDYTTNTKFRKHVEEGIKYAIGNALSVPSIDFENEFAIDQNPVENSLTINFSDKAAVTHASVYNLAGVLVYERKILESEKSMALDVKDYSRGIYIISLEQRTSKTNLKFIKN